MNAPRPAALRYVTDARPGIRRRRARNGFRYQTADGRPLRDPATLARIRSLAIPPAWTNVWICPLPEGHLQATGRDARGRKQYRYHPHWRELREAAKFDRLLEFGMSLRRLRRRVRRDLQRPGLSRDRVLALLVRLLDSTAIRIGNEEYARTNGSFGLTTLKNRHAKIQSSRVQLTFRGKSGVPHHIDVEGRRIAKLIKRCQELPGQELFSYIDHHHEVQAVESADVNEYIRSAMGEDFTAKDFRTWAGTRLTWDYLIRQPPLPSVDRRQKLVREAIAHVAQELGNTCAVCRKHYIHPAVLEAFIAGRLLQDGEPCPQTPRELKTSERTLARFLKQLTRRRRTSPVATRSTA